MPKIEHFVLFLGDEMGGARGGTDIIFYRTGRVVFNVV